MVFKISKRRKFVVTAIVLSLGLLLMQILNLSWRYAAVCLLSLATYLLSAWSLSEGLDGIEWITVLLLPTLFTAGVGLFYFLVPSHGFTRISVIGLYGLGIYSLMLIENIFSVAAIRTIQLLRSAQATGFLMTLVTAFLFYDTIFSYRLDPWLNILWVALVSFPLVLPALWCINLEERVSPKLLIYTFVLILIQGEIALAISFWPISVTVGSLALASALYITLGLSQNALSEKLFSKTINEYLTVGLVVLAVIFLTTHWGG
jgi:hypothetical protein